MRELVVLGTASQAPTRYRNHSGYLLRWDGEGILFDPGEGTQRQFELAGVSAAAVTRICVTHFHGDHCLGLPGVILRVALDEGRLPVSVHYPANGQVYFDRLRSASAGQEYIDVQGHPAAGPGVVHADETLIVRCAPLAHRIETLGWRVDEPDARRMLPERLATHGITGPDVGRMQREGRLDVGGRTVELEEVSEMRRGQSFAFIMDTAWCDSALELAAGVDLLVCESTFLSAEQDVATSSGHLTAREAGRLAAQAGVQRLVLTHFSRRYTDSSAFATEAREEFGAELGDVIVANDLDRIPVPPRRSTAPRTQTGNPSRSSSVGARRG